MVIYKLKAKILITIEHLPHGQLATRKYLLEQGLEVYHLDNSLRQGEVYALARGVYARPNVPIEWQGLAASLRKIIGPTVYIGGMSALVQQGLAHYINFQENINFYSNVKKPYWFDKLHLDISRQWHVVTRIWDIEKLILTKSLQEIKVHNGSWLLASPEQAYIEILTQLPKNVSFELADNIMQGLTSLSPKRLDVLLKACKHVLAKRLFFFFAERHQYPWFKNLNYDNYDVGSGKRLVIKGGKLNSTYQITVPLEFYD